MMTAPGAELLALPLPTRQYASRMPRPGPGFASSRKKMDLPASSTCWMPIGEKIPWLIALFRNSTFAGSTKIAVIGSRPLSISTPTPAAMALVRAVTIGLMASMATSASTAARIPREKLFTSISKPGLIWPSTAWSNFLITQADSGPTIMAPRNIGTSAPTITPMVAAAPMTPPRLPATTSPPV